MERALKLLGAMIGIATLFASVAIFGYLGGFQGVLLVNGLFSKASPIGVLAIFGILIFGGVYFFKAAGQIIKGAVK